MPIWLVSLFLFSQLVFASDAPPVLGPGGVAGPPQLPGQHNNSDSSIVSGSTLPALSKNSLDSNKISAPPVPPPPPSSAHSSSSLSTSSPPPPPSKSEGAKQLSAKETVQKDKQLKTEEKTSPSAVEKDTKKNDFPADKIVEKKKAKGKKEDKSLTSFFSRFFDNEIARAGSESLQKNDVLPLKDKEKEKREKLLFLFKKDYNEPIPQFLLEQRFTRENKHLRGVFRQYDYKKLLAEEIARGNLNNCRAIIEKENSNIHSKEDIVNAPLDINGNTALITAARYNRPDIVIYLLKQHANIDAKNKYGSTALHFAAYGNYVEVVNILMNAGAKQVLNSAAMGPCAYSKNVVVRDLMGCLNKSK